MPRPCITAKILAWLLACSAVLVGAQIAIAAPVNQPAAQAAPAGPTAPATAGSTAAPSAAAGPTATPAAPATAPATPAPATAAPVDDGPTGQLPLFDRIPWTAVIIVFVVLVILAIAIWLLLRWRRQRDAVPKSASEPALASQLAQVWKRFYRDLPARARHFPTVIVLGDAGSGKSHLIDARVDWRSQANQFFPSSVDSPHLQLYLGSDVVVHELSAPLLRDISRATRRALARLWRNLGPSATIVVVVDARALSTTPPDTLRELAQLVRGKIGALPSRCRAGVDVRVCLSHMDQIEGFDELATVVGAQHGALDIGPLGERLADAGALLATARALMGKYEPNLAYGLTNRTSDAFARLVGFYATFPVLLTQLVPVLRSLTGDDPDQPRYPPSGLYLGSIVPDSHVGDPFAVDRSLVAASIVQQRRRHRRGSLAVAAAGVTLVGALMWSHEARVASAEQAIAGYSEQVTTGRSPSEVQSRKVVATINRMHSGERLWLGHSFVERKRELGERFAQDLRVQYLLPMLKVQTINRSTMLYIVALLYASEANGLRALIRDNLDLWVSKINGPWSKLRVPLSVVSAYLDLSQEQYQTAEPFDPEYTGSNWESYIFDKIKPLYEQPQRLSQVQLDDLHQDPPQLYDHREYSVRSRITELLSAQLALATHPPITKLLDSPLGNSDWVEANIVALRGISAALTPDPLEPTSPSTLGELGDDLVRMLSVPDSSSEVYHIAQVKDGTEPFEFDVAKWESKLAAATAALTISAVRDHNLHKPEQAIGFFPAGTVLREVGAGAGAQGPSAGLPGKYTAAAFAQHVAPALDFITERAATLRLDSDEQATLAALYREQIDDYAGHYAAALRAYYESFRFEPGSEEALPFALAALMQPSSWFVRFLTTVSTNATPKLGDGPYYDVMAESLLDFRPLAELLTPAKGTIPGLAPYQQIITELAAALAPAAPAGAAPGGDGGQGAATLATLASSLTGVGSLTLNKLTGVDKDRLAQVSGWLTGANIERNLHAPFLAPVEAVYALGTSAINRAIGQAWSTELSPLIAPILAKFPFRAGARSDVATADLEAVLRAQGKQPGTFWTSFQRWLGPVTVSRSGRYQWLGGVSGPAGVLATINDLARLSRALWDADGNPSALPIQITPQPLDASPADGRVPTLAYLRSDSSAVYAFNQRPGPSTLTLQWWDQGVSSLILKMSKPGTTDTTTYSIDASESPFSFYRLLCRARRPTTQRAQATGGTCESGRGPRVWDIPLDGTATRSVTLTLDTDPWALFQIGR